MKRYVPALAAVLTFVLVFNFFYNVFSLPTFTIASINLYVPKAYAAKDDQPDRLIVNVVDHGSLRAYEFWYHWPYDGWIKKDDWEPVVVYVNKDGQVYAVAFRVHYVWRVSYDSPLVNGTHVRITFLYRWHTPLLSPPPENFVEVKVSPRLGVPPEKIDHDEIIGPAIPIPLIAGLVAGSVSMLVVYFAVDRLVKSLS